MKIPGNMLDREMFYSEVIDKCLTSRQDRIANYERLRSYFLFGAGTDSPPAKYNKIKPHIDQLTSFLFASDTTRFSIELGASVAKDAPDHARTPVLVERLNNKWHDSKADIRFYNGTRLALICNSSFIKLIQRGKRTVPFVVEPDNLGVLREDVCDLEDQEAFVHVFFTTRSQLENDLLRHPNAKVIAARVDAGVQNPDEQMPAGVARIIVSNLKPIVVGTNVQGNVNNPLGYQGDLYRPKTAEELIEMRELWVWNDDANDYQIATLAAGGICIYDRPNFFYPGENPFVHICPNPSHDYFWGHSEVEVLTGLQDMREHRLGQLNMLLDLQVKPPTDFAGWTGMIDEKEYAEFSMGSVISNDQPGAKVTRHEPKVPADTFAEIREIDQMFNEASAISNILAGRSEQGVRSKGHAEQLGRYGSSRPKQRAMIIEDSLETMATMYLKLDQQHDDQRLIDTKGVDFIAEQFTKDFVVKVDGHSSSPVFMEDLRLTANEMIANKAISRASYLKLVRPPMLQELLIDLEKMEAAEKAAAEANQKLEQAKIASKVGGLRAVE